MKVISLLEDTTISENLGTEHGLCLYIEYNDLKILFDLGYTDLFISNAEKLGIDLTDIDFAVISHGHINHGGGLEYFFKVNHTAKVFVTKYTFEPHFDFRGNNVGLDYKVFCRYRDRFVVMENENAFPESIYVFNFNDNDSLYSQSSNGLLRGIPRENGIGIKLIPDDFKHEQYLYFKGGRRVLFSGSSHKGILNIMSWCSPEVFLSGFNFLRLPLDGKEAEHNKKVISEIANGLKKYNCKFYTYHSTGSAQYKLMKSILGDKLEYFSAGMTLEF